jgi:hypothetical protein
MHFAQKRWLHYALLAVPIGGSLISLFALFELGAPSWTIPVNTLSLVCLLLAVTTRGK